MDVRKSINFAKQLKIPVAGVVENMAGFICPHCGESTELFGSGGGVRVAEELEVPFLGSIPFEPAIVHAGDSGKPFARDAKDSPAAVVFAGIVEKITGSS